MSYAMARPRSSFSEELSLSLVPPQAVAASAIDATPTATRVSLDVRRIVKFPILQAPQWVLSSAHINARRHSWERGIAWPLSIRADGRLRPREPPDLKVHSGHRTPHVPHAP